MARIVALFVAIWNVRSMCRRGVRFLSFIELRDLVLVSLHCPWLVRCCPARSNKQRRQDRILPPLPTPGVTIYRSDGACRGQGTNVETHAGWGAAVWSADDRGLGDGVALLLRVVSSKMIIPTTKLNILLFFSACLARFVCRILTLFLKSTLCFLPNSSHVIFLGLVVLKISLLSINSVFMFCDSLSALHMSWDIRHIYREFNQTADALFNQAIDERDTNGSSAFW